MKLQKSVRKIDTESTQNSTQRTEKNSETRNQDSVSNRDQELMALVDQKIVLTECGVQMRQEMIDDEKEAEWERQKQLLRKNDYNEVLSRKTNGSFSVYQSSNSGVLGGSFGSPNRKTLNNSAQINTQSGIQNDPSRCDYNKPSNLFVRKSQLLSGFKPKKYSFEAGTPSNSNNIEQFTKMNIIQSFQNNRAENTPINEESEVKSILKINDNTDLESRKRVNIFKTTSNWRSEKEDNKTIIEDLAKYILSSNVNIQEEDTERQSRSCMMKHVQDVKQLDEIKRNNKEIQFKKKSRNMNLTERRDNSSMRKYDDNVQGIDNYESSLDASKHKTQ